MQTKVPNHSLYSSTPTKEAEQFEEAYPPRTDFQISAANAVHHWSDALPDTMVAGDAALMEWYDYAPWGNWSWLKHQPPSTEESPNKYADLCKRILIMKYYYYPNLEIGPFEQLITYNREHSVNIAAEIESMGGQDVAGDGDGDGHGHAANAAADDNNGGDGGDGSGGGGDVAGDGDGVDAAATAAAAKHMPSEGGQTESQPGKRKQPSSGTDATAKTRAPLPNKSAGTATAATVPRLITRGQHRQLEMAPGPSDHQDPPTTSHQVPPRVTRSSTRSSHDQSVSQSLHASKPEGPEGESLHDLD